MNTTSKVDNLQLLSGADFSALQTLVGLLQTRFGTQLRDVILFGSTARGEATPQSDIDVLIILDAPTAQDQSDARGSSFDVWMETGVFLPVHFMSQQNWDNLAGEGSLFYRNVSRDGISLLPVHTPE
jgi:hypothetical protein